MTYKQMVRKIETAGSWFVAAFMGEFLHKYPEWSVDSLNKRKFIEYMHEEYGKGLDYEYDTTKTKCYAVMSIIREHMVLEALDFVIQSNENKVPQETIENAIILLDQIIADKIILP